MNETESKTIYHLTVPISRVEPRMGQPRSFFDEEALQELADSIALHGLLQPITVRPLDRGYYQIIAGERRWRASRMAGLREVPVNVIDADDRETAILSMIENLQREDLNVIEEALGCRKLMDEFGLTQEDVSVVIGKPRSTVANRLRLLSLHPEVQELLIRKALTPGHAKTLLTIPSRKLQAEAAAQVVRGALTVAETERLIRRLLRPKPARTEDASAAKLDRQLKRLEKRLDCRVRVRSGKKAGRIILEYDSADDRERLLSALLRLGRG